jgi:hypothetical protein
MTDHLFEKGYICDPRGKAKSIVFTEEGLERSRQLLIEIFGQRS